MDQALRDFAAEIIDQMTAKEKADYDPADWIDGISCIEWEGWDTWIAAEVADEITVQLLAAERTMRQGGRYAIRRPGCTAWAFAQTIEQARDEQATADRDIQPGHIVVDTWTGKTVRREEL